MNFLISLMGALIGIILAVAIIIFIIYWKIRKSLGKGQVQELKNAISNISNYQREEYSREKSIKGLTTLLEPLILEDFTDFNKELMFSICERNLRKIFNCIEERSYAEIINDKEFIYLKQSIVELINDMKSNNITERFDNIEFNRHAISEYTKEGGKATIKISTSVGYYYSTNRKDKKSFPYIKKQTRYTSEFVYVYDELKFANFQNVFSIHCPNCGAPIKGLNIKYCEYCGNYVEPINLKTWKMSSYKEDYK